ncbi:CapA family protein [Actinoplanes sp. NEAU-A12]|uniref:CapA family protein n=1 Tax=Actinoplanes sandaracinus TaxID=3045177 RepID=A0ABT6WZ14_9ACTN|nr:CapA family protein [Actinoplanes sandaracinus]MDI6104981.1 CapA family protein [Actinoplanes sandaracinus]
MNSQPRSHQRKRPALAAFIATFVLVGAGLGGCGSAGSEPDPVWKSPAGSAPATGPAGKPVEESGQVESISLSATGDIIMGDAPGKLPANDGKGFFDSVTGVLKSDFVMGNLEQPLTGDTGTSKCGTPKRPHCFAFRAPPAYAKHLKEAGFQLLNTANNHSNDYGPQGYRNTVEALEAAGLEHTGAKDQITVVEVKGVKVAVVGFSSYKEANDLNDLKAAAAVVSSAKEKADLVVVQVHMGAEGAGQTHVKPGNEIYYSENRGDPIKFSHTVIDAGADLVVGHGPHVLRAMEFYKGKLIAYSLGNFAGGGRTLSRDGILKHSGVLHVSLTREGEYAGGKFVSTYLNDAGVPTHEKSDDRGRKMVAELTEADFPETGAVIESNGTIKPSA